MTLYLYALVDRPPRKKALLGRGMGRGPLDVVRVGKAFVVFESAEARAPTTRAVLAHDRIVRRVARLVPSALPLRFGTTAADRAAVRALLEPVSASIVHAFDRVRGAVQLTLRVSGRQAPPSIPARAGPGTRWIAERLARHRVPEIAAVTEATRPWVREARAERLERPSSFASVYHLVAREHLAAWRKAFALASADLPRGVRVTSTGPWPPWAFAELA